MTPTSPNPISPTVSRAAAPPSRAGQQPMVAIQSLTKTFRDFWMRPRARALDGVTFEVYPGEIFGLLGPNGSGKSTTIKIILGLLRQSSGRVAIFGKSPTDVSIKKRIGYLPEESYMYAFLNARETLEYYAKLFQLDARTRESRIDQLLDMVGLTAVQFRPVREYSKGMQRRIGIAQALINDPDLLILDEPTTGLDPLGCRQIKDLILELGRRGKTIILSSHLLSDVEDCVSRMVILYGGKIREEGTCESLLEVEDRMVLETNPLDQDTIAAIDELIRQRTGGASALSRVSHPRQKLEDKFVAMVNRAVQERLATSGAQHGGQTASFLKDSGAQGEALISQLVAGTPDPVPTPAAMPKPGSAAATNKPAEPARDVLDSLLKPAAEPTPPPRPASSPTGAAAPAAGPGTPSANVDRSVIGSLLDDSGPPRTDGGGGRA
ncbi:MAG: ABC transporter ATP-binding protein [Phycisphaerales bacterium]|jgi:ABC-2 type transport system ATP-binding protein